MEDTKVSVDFIPSGSAAEKRAIIDVSFHFEENKEIKRIKITLPCKAERCSAIVRYHYFCLK